MMHRAASFAPLLEQEIPNAMTPGSVDNGDNTEQAGRTPHFRKLEAEQNIIALKKNLQMSGMKINAALYDSPMSVLSTGSENVHPNKLSAESSSSSGQKKGLSSNTLTKKAVITAAHQKSLWSMTPGFEVTRPPAAPAAAATSAPEPAASRSYAPPTPYVFEKPSATVTFSDSIGGPLATELPAPSLASTPCSVETRNTNTTATPASVMSLHSSPAMPMQSPSMDEQEKPQQASPDKLYNLLMGVGSPSNDSMSLAERSATVEYSVAEQNSTLSTSSFGSPTSGVAPELLGISVYSERSPIGVADVAVPEAEASVRSVARSSTPNDDMSLVTASPMTLSMFAQTLEASPQPYPAASAPCSAAKVPSPATVSGPVAMTMSAVESPTHSSPYASTPASVSARPASVAGSAASAAHSLVSMSSSELGSPIMHFQYGQSPTVAVKPPRMPSPTSQGHVQMLSASPAPEATEAGIASTHTSPVPALATREAHLLLASSSPAMTMAARSSPALTTMAGPSPAQVPQMTMTMSTPSPALVVAPVAVSVSPSPAVVSPQPSPAQTQAQVAWSSPMVVAQPSPAAQVSPVAVLASSPQMPVQPSPAQAVLPVSASTPASVVHMAQSPAMQTAQVVQPSPAQMMAQPSPVQTVLPTVAVHPSSVSITAVPSPSVPTVAVAQPSPAVSVARSVAREEPVFNYQLPAPQPAVIAASPAPAVQECSQPFAFPPLPPMPETPSDAASSVNSSLCNTSVSTMSSTASPMVLCRRGGVAMGPGPRPLSRVRVANQPVQETKVRGIAMGPAPASPKVAVHSPAAKAPTTQANVGSAAKPALPRHEAASKVSRKQHPTVSTKHTKSSAAKTLNSSASTTGSAGSKGASPKQLLSGVSRVSKRVKGDTAVCDASTSYSTPCASTASLCGVDESATNLTSFVSECDVAHIESDIVATVCNVSVQCDSFLLAAGKVMAPPTPSQDSMPQPTPLVGRSAYDCFEEGLDGAMSLAEGSQVHQSATLDYSVDTPEQAHHTPPQARPSPIFMSYRKLHHDSDSEDDMAEMGLDELLAGTPQPASPIAKRRYSEESSCLPAAPLSTGTARSTGTVRSTVPKIEWEHSFITAATGRRSATPGSLASTAVSAASTRRTPRTVSSRKSALGSAQRVTPSGEVEVHVIYTAHEHEHLVDDGYSTENTTQRTISQHRSQQWQHSVDFGTSRDLALMNMSALTDKAIVPANLSAAESVANSQVFDLSETQSQATCAETTLTLDHNHRQDMSAGGQDSLQFASAGPRLAVMPLKRDYTAPEDIKEVSFDTRPGETTTVALTIANNRNKTTRLYAHAVSLRFEEYACQQLVGPNGLLVAPEDHDDDGLTVESAAPPCTFQVSPAVLTVEPGGEGTLYVTFVPLESIVGVYSGALKMRTKTKAFTMLLRGKATNLPMNGSIAVPAPAATVATTALVPMPSPATPAAVADSLSPANQAQGTPESVLMQRLQKLNGSAKKNSPSAASLGRAQSSVAVLNVCPDSVLLQKSVRAQRYEASLELELRNREFTEVFLAASVPFLKLSRSRVILSDGNRESVKVLLDDRAPELLALCNTVLALDTASCTTAVAGFVTVRTATEGEYTIDISLTRSACFLIRNQLVAAERAAVAVKSVEKARSLSTPRAGMAPLHPPHSSQRPPMSAPSTRSTVAVAGRSRTASKNSPMSSIAGMSTMSVSSVETSEGEAEHRRSGSSPASAKNTKVSPKSSPKASLKNTSHVTSIDDTLAATAASLLALRHAPANSDALLLTPSSSTRRSPSSSAKRAQSAPRSAGTGSSRKGKSVSVKNDIRNFLRVADEDNADATPVPRPALTAAPAVAAMVSLPVSAAVPMEAIAAPTTPKPLFEKKTGVFFRKDCVDFGAVACGSLTRANIEMNNATDAPVKVYIGDPKRPFVLLHNEIVIKPYAYVRIPIRFTPTEPGQFECELLAQTADGAYHTKIVLAGAAYL